jgi:hypothetical protein
MKSILYLTALVILLTVVHFSCDIATKSNDAYLVENTVNIKSLVGNNDGEAIIIAPLNAGKEFTVGEVRVYENSDVIYITYVTTDHWLMTETHLAVTASLEEIPQTKKGNPIPGKFPLKREYEQPINEDTYEIDIKEGESVFDPSFYIAAHAAVQKEENGNIIQEESAWAAGEDFPGKNWATYMHEIDVFFANFGHPNKVWLHEGLGFFADSGQNLGNYYGYCVELGDLDNDGDFDAFVANYHGEPNKVWLNSGNGNFYDSGQSLGNYYSVGVDLGDVDGDGDLDAYVANAFLGPENQLWLNDGTGNFTNSWQYLGDAYSLGVDLIDVDGDSDLDAFVTNGNNQPNKVWLNDGNGNFNYSGNNGHTLGNSYSHNADLGDLDGDGDLDAFVANYITQPNRVWLNDGAGNFTDSLQVLGDFSSLDVDLGDIDGDGDLDAFVANQGYSAYTPGPNTVWKNNGSGYFAIAQTLGEEVDWLASWSIELADVDIDGDLDAFVANSGPNKVWFNNGNGNFSDSMQFLDNSESRGVDIGILR